MPGVSCAGPVIDLGPPDAGGDRDGGDPGSDAPAGGGPPTSPPDINLPEAGATAAPDTPFAQCASEAHAAEDVPLDLLLLLDSSGSMIEAAGMRSRWVTAQTSLRAFIADPRSAGLGVGLLFFPQDKACTTDCDCVGVDLGRSYCQAPAICAGPGGPAPDAVGCGPAPVAAGMNARLPACPALTTCAPAGRCAGSGALCTTIGQDCAMGGGACTALPKICSFTTPQVECEPEGYRSPNVAIASLPGAEPALVRTLMAKQPVGGTPMGPAVRGALEHLRARLVANPGRKVALILVSDGLPSPCDNDMNPGDIASIEGSVRTAATGASPIGTHVIGVFTPGELLQAQATLNRVAAAGGSGEAIVLTSNDDLAPRLLEALSQIRGAALACEYKIPAAAGGQLDFGKVNLRYTASTGPESLPYVERAERCDSARGGWHYDVVPAAATPTRVVVCPSTCRRFRSDQKARIELVFGCATEIVR